MTVIRLFDHPFSGGKAQEFVAESVAHWLLTRWPNGPTVTLQIFRGEPCLENEITRDPRALVDRTVAECTVLQSPGAEAIAYAASWVVTNWAAIATAVKYAAIAYSVYSAITAGSRGMPGNVNRTSASPNNALAGRDNQVRLRQRIEDIYGTVLAIPSLLMQTYEKRINNRRVEFAYLCVGRGYYDIDRLRDADTLISDLPGASAAVYAPFTSPNSGDAPQLLIGDPIIDPIVTVRRSTQVDGITLKAQNQVQLAASDDYTFIADPGGDIIEQSTKAPNFNAVAEVGDEVTITLGTVTVTRGAGNGVLTVDAGTNTVAIDELDGWTDAGLSIGDTVVVAGFTEAGNNGTFTVLSFPDGYKVELSSSGRVNESYALATLSWQRDYSGTREIASVDDGRVVLTDSVWDGSSDGAVTAAIQLIDKDHKTAWVTIPTADRAEVWINVVALQGMFKDSGGKSTAEVAFTIEIERLDPDTLDPLGTPEVETVTGTMSGRSSDELGQTIEHVTSWVGPCRVRMYRTTAYDYAFNGGIVDEIKWEILYGISYVDREHFDQLTTIHTVTPATVRATSLRTRQLNCLASRKLPTYNGSTFSGVIDATGQHISGTISATSRMIDILAAVFIDPLIGKRTIDELDLAQVWATQQALDAWDPDMGQFNYTFDTDNFTFENTVEAIANAAFCAAYRQVGKTRVQLDQLQSASAAMFTHRNKQPRGEIITRSFANDSDNDGIEFVYRDPDTEQPETIRIPADGSALKPLKLEMPGFRNFRQAWRRAWREYYKLVGKRLAIETGCTTDARLLLPNQRIDIVDNTRFKSNDGEVVGQDGLVLRLSRPVHFKPAVPHSISLMRRNGSFQGITCTAGEDEFHVVLQSLPTEAVVTRHGGADGVRTIYSFAADEDKYKQAYLVTEIDPPKDGYVVVRAVNYSADYYQNDDDEPPDQDTVIN